MASKNKWEGHARLLPFERKERGEEIVEGITPEKIERRNFRANKPYIPRTVYFNKQASIDGVKHFVNGMGDDNPLFTDAEYAKKTKYGGLILQALIYIPSSG